MNADQVTAIKCAHADLIGALQAMQRDNQHAHDWKAHAQTIQELEASFDFLESATDETRSNGPHQ